jgi:platelet-activating factor acetylhydrolase
LFPFVTKKVFKADNPERTLRLNTRAILQVMRENGIEVADTSRIDMEEEELADKVENGANGHLNGHVNGVVPKDGGVCREARSKDLSNRWNVKGWIALDVDENDFAKSTNGVTDAEAMPGEAVMKGEVMSGDSERKVMTDGLSIVR